MNFGMLGAGLPTVVCAATAAGLLWRTYVGLGRGASAWWPVLALLLVSQPILQIVALNVKVDLQFLVANPSSVILYPAIFLALFSTVLVEESGRQPRGTAIRAILAIAAPNVAYGFAAWLVHLRSDQEQPGWLTAIFPEHAGRMALVGFAACMVELMLAGALLAALRHRRCDAHNRIWPAYFGLLALDAVFFPLAVDRMHPSGADWRYLVAGHAVGKMAMGLFWWLALKQRLEDVEGEIAASPAGALRVPKPARWVDRAPLALYGFALVLALVVFEQPTVRSVGNAAVGAMAIAGTSVLWIRPGALVAEPLVAAHGGGHKTATTRRYDYQGLSEKFAAELPGLLAEWEDWVVAYAWEGGTRFGPAKDICGLDRLLAHAEEPLGDLDVAIFHVQHALETSDASFGMA